jgi:rare lipoprotein A
MPQVAVLPLWRVAIVSGRAKPPSTTHRILCVSLLGLLLCGCSIGGGSNSGGSNADGPPAEGARRAPGPDAVPQLEPKSRYGNPPSYVVFGKRYHVLDSAEGFVERGVASWYGKKFHGRRTSSGEPYDMHAMTAAHKSLPLPTYVQVTNLQNHRQLILRVNDRGPFHDNRIIDLSYAAASRLGIIGKGTGLVEVRALTLDASTRPGPGAQATVRPSSAQPSVKGAVAVANDNPQLYLQVGAFADAANAHRLRARLISIQPAVVRVETTTVSGHTVHRVRLGPFADVPSADRISQNIVEAGLELPHIVIE